MMHAYVLVLLPRLLLWPVGKEDIIFDCYREDDFFNQPGFSNGIVYIGDGVASYKLCAARYAGAEAETWESGNCLEVTLDADGTSLQL
jgi:hypothetical protein